MFFGRLRRALGRFSLRLTLWLSLLFMASALGLLVLTDVLLRNRASANEHYVIESRLNQYVSEYKRGGLDAVKQQIRRRIITPFVKPSLFDRFKRRTPGCNLEDRPHGGVKSLLAPAAAGESGARFINLALSEVRAMNG
jgi:ATP-dependent 26S proteasome regulatory subunit